MCVVWTHLLSLFSDSAETTSNCEYQEPILLPNKTSLRRTWWQMKHWCSVKCQAVTFNKNFLVPENLKCTKISWYFALRKRKHSFSERFVLEMTNVFLRKWSQRRRRPVHIDKDRASYQNFIDSTLSHVGCMSNVLSNIPGNTWRRREKKKITVIRLQQQDEKLDSDFKEKIGQWNSFTGSHSLLALHLNGF